MLDSLTSRIHEVDDEADAVEYCFSQGWTDGLPVVPPTPKKVAAFLDHAQLSPEQILGDIPERDRNITAEKLAINAVMAGCRKEYMPVLVAMVEALCDPAFKFNHLASLGSPWPLMTVSGPIVRELELNSGIWALGPGSRANATIGRTLSLLVSNCAEGYPGALLRGTYGHPGRYASMCIAEHPEDFGWEPHHVEMGFAREQSTVTLLSTYPWIETPPCLLMEPEAILNVLSIYISQAGFYRGVYPIIMGRPWAEVFVKAGWDKRRMSDWMIEHTKLSVADLKRRGRWGMFTTKFEGYGALKQEVEPGDDDRYVWLWKPGELDAFVFDTGSTERKTGVQFIVSGGDAGQRTAFLCPYMFSTNPVTKAIRPLAGRH
jgi:hypothetical protein